MELDAFGLAQNTAADVTGAPFGTGTLRTADGTTTGCCRASPHYSTVAERLTWVMLTIAFTVLLVSQVLI